MPLSIARIKLLAYPILHVVFTRKIVLQGIRMEAPGRRRGSFPESQSLLPPPFFLSSPLLPPFDTISMHSNMKCVYITKPLVESITPPISKEMVWDDGRNGPVGGWKAGADSERKEILVREEPDPHPPTVQRKECNTGVVVRSKIQVAVPTAWSTFLVCTKACGSLSNLVQV